MNEDDFYILLDWDNIGHHEMMRRVILWLMPDESIKEIEVRASPSLDGYHIYIKNFYFLNPVLIFKKRFDWHDDREKLCMDWLNQNARHRGDLFSKKIYIKYGGAQFSEIKMFKYFRKSTYEQWEITILQKKKRNLKQNCII